MNETKTEWRDCADPDELAAAVAAGVEVLRMRGGGWVPSALTHRDDFAWFLTHGTRYQLPASWTWRPEPTPEPDDLRERIARAAAGGYMRVPIVALDGMYLGPPWLDVADAVLAVLPTPLPVPPWPGAVLSGLVDEDGVPTWLAQAGQVRGEQARIWHGEQWGKPHGSWADSRWVEVRAPRAVPAALVTVTIPAETAHALLRYIEDGDYDTDYVIDRLADLLIAAMDGDQ